ncbi:MAG TPA: AraC family transcriptional regulator [Microvirga sp.]
MSATAPTQLHGRFGAVLAHIEEHLDGDLGLDALSAVAAYSPCHFQRQFSAFFGISLHRYVQLARLRRASYKLAFRAEEPVIGIALDSGYDAPEAFSRAFKQRLGQTPSAFRADPDWASWHETYRSFDEIRRTQMTDQHDDRSVTVVTMPDLKVAALEHRGDHALLGASIRRFIAWRREAALPPRTHATYNILYDDPDSTPPDAFRIDLCVATDRAVEPNEAGNVGKVIPGGRCAVLRHTGNEPSFAAAIQFLYAEWLPQSGETVRDVPLYCRRVSFFPDVPEHRAVTDLYLPLGGPVGSAA